MPKEIVDEAITLKKSKAVANSDLPKKQFKNPEEILKLLNFEVNKLIKNSKAFNVDQISLELEEFKTELLRTKDVLLAKSNELPDRTFIKKLDIKNLLTLVQTSSSEDLFDLIVSSDSEGKYIRALLKNFKKEPVEVAQALNKYLNSKSVLSESVIFAYSKVAEHEAINLLNDQSIFVLLYILYQEKLLKEFEIVATKCSSLESVFTSADSKKLIGMLDNLAKINIDSFLSTVSNLNLDKIPFSLVQAIREFLSNYQIRLLVQKDLSKQFHTLILYPAINLRINNARKLEDAIDLLVSIPELKFPESKEAFKSQAEKLFNVDSPLTLLLKDPEMPNVLRKLNAFQKNEDELRAQIRDSALKIKSQENEINQLHERLQFADQRIIELSQIQRGNQAENSREIKISELKRLLPIIDQLILKYGEDLMFNWAQMGLQAIGENGKEMIWNPDYCESITGNQIESGKVLQRGYLVDLDGQLVVLKRALLGG